jgi:catechol 2,3-dioxygenase-like lactoylglutathione lyase family enzyme
LNSEEFPLVKWIAQMLLAVEIAAWIVLLHWLSAARDGLYTIFLMLAFVVCRGDAADGHASGEGGTLMETDPGSQSVHRWYARPVLFVADVKRALNFYVDALGFEKRWHEGDGAGGVCQVDRGGCEIILCEDSTRRDRGRLFVELTADAIADLRGKLATHAVPARETWWGSDAIQIADPDGNELLFPVPE